MRRGKVGARFGGIALDPKSGVPRVRQIADGLRAAILEGRLAPGAALRSSRALAQELGVARNTVVEAIELLRAEGYVEARQGSGTFVARRIPRLPRARTRLSTAPPPPLPEIDPGLAPFGALHEGAPRAFAFGLPALDAFPVARWTAHVSAAWRRHRESLLRLPPSGGLPVLRAAITRFLLGSRGVDVRPDQVIVTAGAQQALHLVARVLVRPADAAWIEEPGYLGARMALTSAGARIVPVPVDHQGLDVDAGRRLAPGARIVFVTPAHQVPLGVMLVPDRRAELLAWAKEARAWIIEDDWEGALSDFASTGPTLHALDGGQRVVLVGSFSTLLFPALRLGYAVFPRQLAGAAGAVRAAFDGQSPAADQAALAEFLDSGQLERHIRRSRALYAERRAVVAQAAAAELRGQMTLQVPKSGTHLLAWLAPHLDERLLCERARAAGVELRPLSLYRAGPGPAGVVLGFGGAPPDELRAAISRLAAVCRAHPR